MSKYCLEIVRIWKRIQVPIFMLIFVTACSYTTPQTRVPTPLDGKTNKEFFRNADGTPKTFVCAYAPLNAVGFKGKRYNVHNASTLPACNVQFEITENLLIGRQVNPSIKDPNGWAKIVTIPISSHYTFRQKEDKYGRKMNEWIEDSKRDKWDARPSMKLKLRGFQIHDWAMEMNWGRNINLAIDNYEKTQHKGKSYLAFNVTVSDSWYGSHMQARYRVNFLEFTPESGSTFKPRLTHEDNSQHFGTLWGMGKRIDDIYPVQFVARWDLRPEALPHKLCLNGFEGASDARQIAVESIELWNIALRDVGLPYPAFVISDEVYKYPFDLRCNSITYVQDRGISNSSPLGIAMAQADVLNGKMLWGGMVVYGGSLESYVEYFASNGQSLAFQRPEGSVFSPQLGEYLDGGYPFQDMVFPTSSMKNIEGFREGMAERSEEIARVAQEMSRGTLSHFLEGLGEHGPFVDTDAMYQRIHAEQQSLFSPTSKYGNANDFTDYNALEDLEKLVVQLERMILEAIGRKSPQGEISTRQRINSVVLAHATWSENVIDSTQLTEFTKPDIIRRIMVGGNDVDANYLYERALFGENAAGMSDGARSAHLRAMQKKRFMAKYRMGIFDADHTIANKFMNLGMVPAGLEDEADDIEKIIRVSLKETIMHEFGHVLGLAHNFEDNIMPKKGSVPTDAYDDLEIARDKKFYQNVSTIMGYPHPYVTLARSYKSIEVGPQDKLILRFIYNNTYPVYDGTSKEYVDHIQVPPDGRIPGKNEKLGDGLFVSYFPYCSDLDQFFGTGHMCNRWDRGYNATTISEAYIEDFRNNWISRLENLGDMQSASPWRLRRWLWSKSLSTFGRVRKFYDYMRRQYSVEIKKISDQNPATNNLYDFSKCANANQTNDFVRETILGADPEFEELCNVNRNIIEKLNSFITDPGPDFTTYDDTTAAFSSSWFGVDSYSSWARVFGTFKELSVLPIKYSALHTLTTARPFWNWGPYIIPIEKYSRPGKNTKYSYASLYPYEFTNAISTSVTENIKISTAGGDKEMGRIAMFMGSFLYSGFKSFYSTNDYHPFGNEYMSMITTQSRFIFNNWWPFVPIFIRVVRDKDTKADPDRVQSFSAVIYEWGEEPVELGDAYALPKGKMIFSASPNQFVYPVTDMIFLTDNLALTWGIRVQYETNPSLNLSASGIKEELYEKYQDVLTSCILGDKGLKEWFQKYDGDEKNRFKGFKIVPGIASYRNRFETFTFSVDDEFSKYWQHKEFGNKDPEFPKICTRALENVGLVLTTALSLNNIWLPQITRHIYK